MNFYQCAEINTISSFCSRDIPDLKTLQPDQLRVFQPIQGTRVLLEMGFVQKYNTCSVQTKFRKKVMTKSLTNFKKLCFWPNLDHFWDTFFFFFSRNVRSVTQNLVSKKLLGQMDKRADGSFLQEPLWLRKCLCWTFCNKVVSPPPHPFFFQLFNILY